MYPQKIQLMIFLWFAKSSSIVKILSNYQISLAFTQDCIIQINKRLKISNLQIILQSLFACLWIKALPYCSKYVNLEI